MGSLLLTKWFMFKTVIAIISLILISKYLWKLHKKGELFNNDGKTNADSSR